MSKLQVTRSAPIQSIKILASDSTNSTNTHADVTGAVFNIGVNETWSYEFYLNIGCNNTGGVIFRLNPPSGSTHNTIVTGMGATTGSIASSKITGTTETGSAFNTVNFTSGWARITGSIVNSTTAGAVQLQFKSNINTQTSTVYAGSHLEARKIS